MRIRSIKPEFYRSEDIAVLSREDRLLFIGLWSYVDDDGRGIDDHRLIAADLFPLDDDQKETREFVREGLATLSRGLLISRYEVEGRRYFYVTGWKRHQRVDKPNLSRFPAPPENPDPPTSGYIEERQSRAGDSRETPESPAPGTEEQRNRSKTPSRSAAGAEPDGFAEFYDAYPRKRERKKAVIAFRSVLRSGVPAARLVKAASSYAQQSRGKQIDYLKYPASWLNAGAYDDEPEQAMLALVPVASVLASFEEFHLNAAGIEAARILGIAYLPRQQPPSDATAPRQWAATAAVEWIDAHESEIRTALAERKTG